MSIETMSDEAVVQRVTDHHDNDGSFAVNPQSVARTTREALGAINVLCRVAGSQDDAAAIDALIFF